MADVQSFQVEATLAGHIVGQWNEVWQGIIIKKKGATFVLPILSFLDDMHVHESYAYNLHIE